MKLDFKCFFLLLASLAVSCSGGSGGSSGGGGGITPSTPVLPTGVSLNSTSLSLKVGETSQLVATVTPSNAENKSINWSSNNSDVATVKSGLVTAVSPGNAIVTVTTAVGNKTASCAVTVQKNKVSVTGIQISKSSIAMKVGESTSLQATVTPSNVDDKKVNWSSSNQSVVTVSAGSTEGTVTLTAVAEGTATITAKSNDNSSIQATCSVTVTKEIVKVTGVQLNKNSAEIYIGDELSLSATISPANATNKKVNWISGDVTIATVTNGKTDGIGVVKALKAGNVTITVRSDDDASIEAVCQITVKKVDVTSVSLNKNSVEITEGGSTQIIATVAPTNATNKKINWSVSDPTVASVTPSADSRTVSVSALKVGAVTVTATSDDNSSVKANCTVTVKSKTITVTAINLSHSSVDVKIGKTFVVTATVVPANATYKDVEWSIDDVSVASIVTSGSSVTVKGLKEGTATLTAKSKQYPSVTSTCTITSSAIAVTSVVLDKHDMNLKIGNSASLSATVLPSDATYKDLVWTCNKTGYATIVQNGNSATVTALKAGTIIVTVSSQKQPSVNDSCTVVIPVKDGGNEGTEEEPWK